MIQLVINWVLGSKKAIAAALVAGLLGLLRLLDVEVLPESAEGLQVFLEGLVVGIVTWFTTNKVGAVDRKK